MEMKNVKPEYIVYCSHAGHTKRYAEMFAEATGLPIMTNKEAMRKLKENSKIIYFGWVQTNIIQGYKEAKAKFDICAVVSVGMFGRGTGVKALRHVSGIRDDIPLFPLKGGIEMRKLGPVYKAMMMLMRPGVIRDLKLRKDPSPLERDMLRTITQGGDYVKPEYLEMVIKWYELDEYEEQDFFDDFSGEYVDTIVDKVDGKLKEKHESDKRKKMKKIRGTDAELDEADKMQLDDTAEDDSDEGEHEEE